MLTLEMLNLGMDSKSCREHFLWAEAGRDWEELVESRPVMVDWGLTMGDPRGELTIS